MSFGTVVASGPLGSGCVCYASTGMVKSNSFDSAQMSEHYTHVGQEAMRKAAEALPDVLAK